MPIAATSLAAACLLAVVGLVVAERKASRSGRTIFKLMASTTFVLLALVLGAAESAYGRLVLLALILCWLGDLCLLSRRSTSFMAGLIAFLAAHVVFALAFATASPGAKVPGPTVVVAVVAGILLLRWLWPHLSPTYRLAVAAYVVAILTMCVLAVSLSLASGRWIYGGGALAFAASDLAVARDRFVVQGWLNRAWGLPVYYASQLLLASTVATGGSVAV